MTQYNSFKRVDIVNFFELSGEDQSIQLDNDEESENATFLVDVDTGDFVDTYDDYMRTQGGRYHGVKCTGNASGNGIIVSNCGSQAVIKYFK